MIRATTLMAAFAISVSLIAFSTSQVSAAIVKAQCDKGESLQERLIDGIAAQYLVIKLVDCRILPGYCGIIVGFRFLRHRLI